VGRDSGAETSGLALEVCFQAIDECRPFFLGILGQRYGYVAANAPKDMLSRRAWLSDYAGRSLTELEIIHAVLREPQTKVRAFFYFRDPAALNEYSLTSKNTRRGRCSARNRLAATW